MLHLMQIRMHVVWEYFSTSLEGVVGACEKLHDFFVQYLKFWVLEPNKNLWGRQLFNLIFISRETFFYININRRK